MNKFFRAGLIACFAFLFLLSSFSMVLGATYYIAPSPLGSDTNPGTSAAPWQTFTKAWSVLQAGDILIVKDSTYANTDPPAGKAGIASSPITVQAENDGGAIINSGITFKGNSYITVIGMKVIDPSKAVDIVSNGTDKPSHDLIFQRISFNCNGSPTIINDKSCFSLSDGTHHVLLEDSWGWGNARYTVKCYGGPGGNPPNTTCDYNTFRRLVLRQGPSTSSSGNPQAGLSLYYANNNVVENVIVIDSVPASNSSNSAFYLTAHVPPPNVADNKFYGVIGLNNTGRGLYIDADNGADASNTQIRNSVFWDSVSSGLSFYISGTCTNTIVDHIISGSNGEEGLWNYCSSTSIRSSIFVDNATYGISQGGQGSSTSNYNDFFGNSLGTTQNLSGGPNDITSNPQLKYILRTESATPCKGAGEGGTDCGANVVNRYVNGVETTESLWPWPNEARIKADMCTGVDATRGFCAKASLTEYIWTYLGNPMPPEFPPAAPKNLIVK